MKEIEGKNEYERVKNSTKLYDFALIFIIFKL